MKPNRKAVIVWLLAFVLFLARVIVAGWSTFTLSWDLPMTSFGAAYLLIQTMWLIGERRRKS